MTFEEWWEDPLSNVYLLCGGTQSKAQARATWKAAQEAEREACCEAIRVACPACGGSGVCGTGGIEYVTRDMALDACEPAMEGMPIYQDTVECEYCGRPIAAIRARRQP